MIWDILGCIWLGSFFALLCMAAFAPEGWEDDTGFHAKRQPDGLCRHVFADREG